jgi:hypothetical protein
MIKDDNRLTTGICPLRSERLGTGLTGFARTRGAFLSGAFRRRHAP